MSKMRSFDLVDFKAAESDFFLDKLKTETFDPMTVHFYFSAFVAAARSITFCLIAVMKDRKGFSEWYEVQQDKLKISALARFFKDARNISQKVGVVPISRGSMTHDAQGSLRMKFFFDRSNPEFGDLPSNEVTEACTEYFSLLAKVLHDCYIDFGTDIDPHQHYTKANFEKMDRAIDDADEELMGVRGWTYVEGWPEAYRWQALRDQLPGCRIGELFEKYLNLEKPYPPRLPGDPKDYDGEYWFPPCLRK